MVVARLCDDSWVGHEYSEELTGSKWTHRISGVNGAWTNTITTVGGVVTGASFSTNSTAVFVTVFTVGVIILLIGFLLDFAAKRREGQHKEREERQKRGEEDRLRKERDNERKRYVELIEQLGVSTFIVAKALHDAMPMQRRHELEIAKSSILTLVSRILGPQEGVRANLFEVRSTEPPFEMVANKWGHAGRTPEPSSRIFKSGDTTFELAMKGRSRFVGDVNRLADVENKGNGYGTFATHPIFAGDDCYGILTVDAVQAHDLELLDEKLLTYYAGLLTICFVADGDRPAINRKEHLSDTVEDETLGDDAL